MVTTGSDEPRRPRLELVSSRRPEPARKGEVVTLAERRGQRTHGEDAEPERAIHYCVDCGSYGFKLVKLRDDLHLQCAACEKWVDGLSMAWKET